MSYKTTFRKIQTDSGKVTAARIWDIYKQTWRLFSSYGEIPLQVRASLSQAERDLLRIKLS